MNYTTNYNLNKPERNEQFNLDDWNNNTDAIDTAMNTNKTNIANNASNISTILTGLSTVNTSDTNSVYYKLMKLIYPVGSIYWSSKSTNPGTLFGGTWAQIKDRFVLACGDTYNTTGATGGASTVTLSVSNMPSHNHTFTPSGTITMDPHSHRLNDHTHSFTPSGIISRSIEQASFFLSWENSKGVFAKSLGGSISYTGHYIDSSIEQDNQLAYCQVLLDFSHTHTFTGSVGTTGVASGNTASATSTGSFSGTQGTTDSNGSGTAFNILPPYVVKYCWERTA